MHIITSSSAPELNQPCRTADQLWLWVRHHLNLLLPRRPVCPGHVAPFDYLRAAYTEPARDLVVWAPRGGGKTRLGAAATLLDLLHKPGCSIRILGGSLEQSLRMWEHLLPDLESLAPDQIAGKPRARRVRLASGSVAAVITQSQRCVRGLRVQKLRCDEVELFDPAIWEAAQLVTRSRPPFSPVPGSPADFANPADPAEIVDPAGPIAGAIEALSTFHVPGGLMERIIDRAAIAGTPILKWCLLETLEKCTPDRPCDGCLLFEECQGRAKSICEGFVAIDDAIRMKRRVSIETWQAEMLCLRPLVEGRVFPAFDTATHVRESMPGPDAPPLELWLAIDFGFSAPFVCLWIQHDSAGRSFVLDEYLQRNTTMDGHIEEIKRRPHGTIRHIACDPAGSAANDQTGQSDVQQLRREGWTLHYRKSRIIDGVELVRAALSSGSREVRLFIHPRCVNLIAAMRSYRYESPATERPCKDGTHDHPIDALRYYYINRPRIAVEGMWY